MLLLSAMAVMPAGCAEPKGSLEVRIPKGKWVAPEIAVFQLGGVGEFRLNGDGEPPDYIILHWSDTYRYEDGIMAAPATTIFRRRFDSAAPRENAITVTARAYRVRGFRDHMITNGRLVNTRFGPDSGDPLVAVGRLKICVEQPIWRFQLPVEKPEWRYVRIRFRRPDGLRVQLAQRTDQEPGFDVSPAGESPGWIIEYQPTAIEVGGERINAELIYFDTDGKMVTTTLDQQGDRAGNKSPSADGISGREQTAP